MSKYDNNRSGIISIWLNLCRKPRTFFFLTASVLVLDSWYRHAWARYGREIYHSGRWSALYGSPFLQRTSLGCRIFFAVPTSLYTRFPVSIWLKSALSGMRLTEYWPQS